MCDEEAKPQGTICNTHIHSYIFSMCLTFKPLHAMCVHSDRDIYLRLFSKGFDYFYSRIIHSFIF